MQQADSAPRGAVRGEKRRPMLRRESRLDLFREAEAVEELPDGYAFRFACTQERIGAILKLITVERSCSPFLTFELIFSAQEGPLWLRLRGPAESKAYIENGLSAPQRLA
jgi:hypothetical protein